MNINQINPLVLAYLGDAIYETYIREMLIRKNICKVNDLQKEAVNYVSARAQAKILFELLNSNILFEVEIEIIKRARNTKSASRPKSVDILTYKHATALEALIGYLYFENQKERIDLIMSIIMRE